MSTTPSSFDNYWILWSIVTHPAAESLFEAPKSSRNGRLKTYLRGENRTVSVLLRPSGLTDEELKSWKTQTLTRLAEDPSIKSANVKKAAKRTVIPPVYFSVHSLTSSDGVVRSRVLSTEDTICVLEDWYIKDVSKDKPEIIAYQFRPVDTRSGESA